MSEDGFSFADIANIIKRISELEKKLLEYRKMDGIVLQKNLDELLKISADFSKNNDYCLKELNELKEDYKRNSRIIDAAIIKQLKLNEVLLMIIDFMDISEDITHKFADELRSKLDGVGSARQTVKKEVDSGFIKEGYYVNVFGEIKPIPKKDSGGEKDGASRDDGRVELKDSDSTNSKPAEPKYNFICGGCKKEFESYHDGIGYNTGFCPKCLEIHETIGLDEPRENDWSTKEYMKIDMKNACKIIEYKDPVIVKREDLQWLFNILEGWHDIYPKAIDIGEKEHLIRIKEEYNIE